MKLLIESLKNDNINDIYMEIIYQGGDIIIHFTTIHSHISGYYLLRINREGMSKFKDVGEVDRHGDFIKLIITDDERKLRTIGVDLV